MISPIADKIASGERLTEEDALTLFRSPELFTIGRFADRVNKGINGDRVYFIRNHHINPTNICVNRCKFCAFSRSKGDTDAFELSIDHIVDKLRSYNRQLLIPFREVHIVGGLHPDWQFEYYLTLLSTLRKTFPLVHIKAFTAVEVDYFSRISSLDLEATLKQLKGHGLDMMPGGGAEIFSPSVRERLCPEKITGERWLEVHETAHRIGIRSNATMLYGHIETHEERISHLVQLRDLQDRTSGFQAFIPLSYHPKNTEIGGSYPSGIDDLKTIAISRLMLDNISHIKAYWIMLGEKLSQTALLFGADDIDGTVVEEKITHAAGAISEEGLSPEDMNYLIERTGKTPVERDSFYREITGEHEKDHKRGSTLSIG